MNSDILQPGTPVTYPMTSTILKPGTLVTRDRVPPSIVALVLTITKDHAYYAVTGGHVYKMDHPAGVPQYLDIYLAHNETADLHSVSVSYTLGDYLCRVPLHEDAKGPKGVYHKSSSYIVAEHLPLEYLPPVLGHWDASIRDVALRRLAQGT